MKLNDDFIKICNKDIVSMYKEIEQYIPSVITGYLDQSIILEENKRIIFQNIKDQDNNKIGKEIKIYFKDNELSYINIKVYRNRISLKKKYYLDDNQYLQKYEISLIENIIKKEKVIYINNIKEATIDYFNILKNEDLIDYNNQEPIIENKTKNKIRKRD